MNSRQQWGEHRRVITPGTALYARASAAAAPGLCDAVRTAADPCSRGSVLKHRTALRAGALSIVRLETLNVTQHALLLSAGCGH
jgi:hypothetical protein